jgi:hypothetical protein
MTDPAPLENLPELTLAAATVEYPLHCVLLSQQKFMISWFRFLHIKQVPFVSVAQHQLSHT